MGKPGRIFSTTRRSSTLGSIAVAVMYLGKMVEIGFGIHLKGGRQSFIFIEPDAFAFATERANRRRAYTSPPRARSRDRNVQKRNTWFTDLRPDLYSIRACWSRKVDVESHSAGSVMSVRDLILGLGLLGLVMLTLYPLLVHARLSANPAQAIVDTRSVISANQTYASANCGRFAETLECMTRRHGSICIPNYPDQAPEFLGGDLGRPPPYHKSGYVRDYQALDLSIETKDHCAPRSPRFFCYVSSPSTPGLTGTRSFVGTATGAIFEDPYGGDTRCVALPTADATEWGAPANAHLLDSPFVRRVAAWRNFWYGFLWVQLFFWPSFLGVSFLSYLNGKIGRPRLVLGSLAVGVASIVLSPDLLIFVPLSPLGLLLLAAAPSGAPKGLRAYAYLTVLSALVAVAVKFVTASL